MKRYKHNLSHFKEGTCNLGELVPISCIEVLPNDSFQHEVGILLRFSPLLAPVMHPIEVRIHHFYVPNRLLWTSWEDFITGGSDGNDTSTIPTITSTTTVGNLEDYFGIERHAGESIIAFPFRAYNKIFNTYYRDQDLTTEVTEDSLTVQTIAWEKDFYTTARSSAQKGDAVSIFANGQAPVTGIGKSNQTYASSPGTIYETGGTSSTSYTNAQGTDNATGPFYIEGTAASGGYPNIYADLSSATGITVGDLRDALAQQRFKEARAMYGSEYVDYLRYLGVNPSDSRLQRPEYLGGGKQTVSFSEVLATAPESTSSTNIGDFGGHGIAALKSNRYRKYFEEHGWVISLMSVRPKQIWSQGIPRKFQRSVKEDYFQKELELIGSTEIYNKEVYAAHTTPEGVFGYTANNYEEYANEESTVCGEFRPGQALDHWTLARSFSSDPALNDTFIKCSPSNRIFASTSTDQLIFMANHKLYARRMVNNNPKPRII
jgi:hypothetical protein